jgi:1-acyl-sn-glycerol-3-phosphate acyltransferase
MFWQVGIFKIFLRPILWSFGITRINYPKLRINDVIGSYKPTRDVSGTAPLVVSNHISWLDMFFYLMVNVSFLSKSEMAKVPFVGTFATARQCLYITRESESDRSKVMEMIIERARRVISHDDISPLLIFPEGTVTNGKSLMSFKRGAFSTGYPIKIYVLKYNTEPLSLSWSLSNMNSLHTMLLSLTQLWNTIDFIEYEDNFDPHWVYQTKQVRQDHEDSWKEVAAVVKKLMAFAGNLHTDETTHRDLKDLLKSSHEYNAQLLRENAAKR